MEHEQETLYGISAKLLAAHGARFPRVEPHDADDPDSSDYLWLSVEEDEMSEGEVIGLRPLSNARWYAYHDLAHKYGGWPTVWEFSGPEADVLDAIAAYLAGRCTAR